MERTFKSWRPTLGLAALKVVIDQLSYGPCCNLLALSWFALAVEGKSLGATREKLWRDYLGVQLAAWRLWPAVALLNYRFVPLQVRTFRRVVVCVFWGLFLSLSHADEGALFHLHPPQSRVLFVNLVGLAWSTFLSIRASAAAGGGGAAGSAHARPGGAIKAV